MAGGAEALLDYLPYIENETQPADAQTALIALALRDGKSEPALLEALKEEMFQLEVEHKQGSISQQEYERARGALDQTLERAIKRVASPPKNAPARD